MKLEIDTTAKTITFKESVNIQELYTQLLLLFPKGEWREYSIVPNYVPVESWTSPWTITPWVTPPWNPSNPIYPSWPSTEDPVWKLPTITCGTDPINASDNKITVTYSNK